MANYEIMLIVSGSLEEKAADKIALDILKESLKETKIETNKYGLKKLAYPIKKDDHGFYFQYNFETDNIAYISEYRRLCNINKNILRLLIVNLEKDYGYKATKNPKKIKNNEIQAKKYALRKSEFEKTREARQQEFLSRRENGDENVRDGEKDGFNKSRNYRYNDRDESMEKPVKPTIRTYSKSTVSAKKDGEGNSPIKKETKKKSTNE